MIRDKIKNKQYFDDFILTIKKSNERRFEKLKNNQIKGERISIVKKDLSKNYLRIFYASYSRGDNLFSKETKNDFDKAICLLDESWKKNHIGIIKSQVAKDVFLKQYGLSEYVFVLNLLSLGVLLNYNKSELISLINFIDKDEVKDYLLEFMISYVDQDRKIIKNESYKEFFGINEKFETLKTVVKREIDHVAQTELKAFLVKEWNNLFEDMGWYNQHKNLHNTYSGYWCFVAAAIVKIKGLDDASFRENEYYPKDLINNSLE